MAVPMSSGFERVYLREHDGRTSHRDINRRLAQAPAHVRVHVHPTRASLDICKHAWVHIHITLHIHMEKKYR